jgi:hypothetical protein
LLQEDWIRGLALMTSPAGIAKGPGNLIYQASTLAGLVRVWEAQPDHTLKETGR